jgi:hypothetical protein
MKYCPLRPKPAARAETLSWEAGVPPEADTKKEGSKAYQQRGQVAEAGANLVPKMLSQPPHGFQSFLSLVFRLCNYSMRDFLTSIPVCGQSRQITAASNS